MKFEKISASQFLKDVKNCAPGLTEEAYIALYDQLKLPKRATSGSAGYDFYAPYAFQLEAGESIKIPTGIRVLLDNDKFLAIYPRSSLGFKFKLQIWNEIPVIDADFYNNPNNEGNIFIKLYNDSPEGKTVLVRQGEAFVQGVIQQYFKIDDDDVQAIREGGIGSTNE